MTKKTLKIEEDNQSLLKENQDLKLKLAEQVIAVKNIGNLEKMEDCC